MQYLPSKVHAKKAMFLAMRSCWQRLCKDLLSAKNESDQFCRPTDSLGRHSEMSMKLTLLNLNEISRQLLHGFPIKWDVHGAQGVNPGNFYDALTFYFVVLTLFFCCSFFRGGLWNVSITVELMLHSLLPEGRGQTVHLQRGWSLSWGRKLYSGTSWCKCH